MCMHVCICMCVCANDCVRMCARACSADAPGIGHVTMQLVENSLEHQTRRGALDAIYIGVWQAHRLLSLCARNVGGRETEKGCLIGKGMKLAETPVRS